MLQAKERKEIVDRAYKKLIKERESLEKRHQEVLAKIMQEINSKKARRL